MRKANLLLVITIMILNVNVFAQEGRGHNEGRKGLSSLISDLMNSGYIPLIVNTSSEIGIFEVLNGKSLTAKEISDNLKTKEEVTDGLLPVLKAIKLLEFSDGKYSLTTEAATYLVKSSPKNQLDRLNDNTITVEGPMANLKAALLGELKRAETNSSASSSQWQDKERLVAMKKRMSESEQMKNITSFISSLPEFPQCRKMMDFAGSIGYYAMGILDKNPNLKAHVYDLPEVCDIAIEVQKEEKNFDRVTFHGFDMRKNDPIGDGYDLFFVSNALYGQRSKEKLVEFFRKANKSLVMGGVLASNHWTTLAGSEAYFSATVSDLMSSFHGRPVHSIDETILKEALKEAGFDNFSTQLSDPNIAKPVLLLAARKVREI